MLPRRLKPPLSLQIAARHKLHNYDLEHGYGDVYLPYAWPENTQMRRPILSGSMCFPPTRRRLIHGPEK